MDKVTLKKGIKITVKSHLLGKYEPVITVENQSEKTVNYEIEENLDAIHPVIAIKIK
jgi:hypothetical protein